MKTIAVALICLMAAGVSGGFGQTTFQKTYGGMGVSVAYSVKQTTDGGYIVAGTTNSFGAGGDDVYLIKTNSTGDTLWTKTYGGIGNESGTCVQ